MSGGITKPGILYVYTFNPCYPYTIRVYFDPCYPARYEVSWWCNSAQWRSVESVQRTVLVLSHETTLCRVHNVECTVHNVEDHAMHTEKSAHGAVQESVHRRNGGGFEP